MSELQRNIWVLSRPACAQVNGTMQNLTGVHHKSSEQIKDLSNSRIERDFNDLSTIKTFLEERNPFKVSEDLVNIVTGMHANLDMNVDNSKAIGISILQGMQEKSPANHVFRRKEQAVTLASRNAVKLKEDSIVVDPNLMFQCLASVAVKSGESLSNTLRHELCSYPSSLFDSVGIMKEPKKPQLADSLSSLIQHMEIDRRTDMQHVLDGGSLLHRIPWEKKVLIKMILLKYQTFVKYNYGECLVVFDGYDKSSTKDMTHVRRRKGNIGVEVSFDENTILMTSKDLFLSNTKNKAKFIKLLGKALQSDGCEVYHARGDADLLICKKAIEKSTERTVSLVGDDTDLLVLLLHHARSIENDIIITPHKNSKKSRNWSIVNAISQLPSHISENILFIHALLGTDTTSRIQGMGSAASGVAKSDFSR